MLCLCWLFSTIFLQLLVVAVALLLLSVCWMLFANKSPYALKQRDDEEWFFVDEHGERIKFSGLADDSAVTLSVIVPAYNEQYRLRPMLDSCLQWLTSVYLSSFEVIVVSDGSTDRTCDVVMEYVQKYGSDQVRLLKLTKNRGKGGAVSLGMLSARGQKLLIADADGATKFEDLEKLETELQLLTKNAVNQGKSNNSNFCAVICGSRAHLESEAKAQRVHLVPC